MLYTEDFSMHHYVGFSQIGSHMYIMITLLIEYLTLFYTAAPMLDTPSSSNLTVHIGSPLTLSCTSRDSPPDTFTWKKNNDPTILQSTSITAMDYTNTSAVFRANYSVDNVTTSDAGTYTCNVTNPIGSDTATITVVIIGKLLIIIIMTIIIV